MVRKILKIDDAKCNGCGLCISVCHEGAISLIDGKAKLLRDDYCDGLGNCLPVCPTGAITFEEREAAEYDEAAVMANIASKQTDMLACSCPGTHPKTIERENCCESVQPQTASAQTNLNQWPVQIKLVPMDAPYFNNANLLVAADCAAYAYSNFHAEYMKNRITVIGCPKLDDEDYSEKLTELLKQNSIKSVTVARMEVPCCGGIESAVKIALQNCGKMIPWQVVTISTDGKIIEN
ncbi:MAG: 4Fe-4S binding protein [Eubacteriaceae bacterium]|nr:4Fe-4S binding protein [Eubacteriaceae bacterium]